MSEETIVRFCAPTLAKMKAGSLFSCRFASWADLVREVRALNVSLVRKGLRVIPLRFRAGTGLIYVFRPDELSRALACPIARGLLKREGYETLHAGPCLKRLARRLREGDAFPHEIGLFLGYPGRDVEGFMERREAKMCGYWKVYGDVPEAKRTFERMRRCTDAYLERLRGGVRLEQLAV